MLEWALKYLEMGWSVIPLKPRSKEPALASWREYQTRLPTRQEVVGWFTKSPLQNLAIVTGAVSRLCVVDVDSPDGMDSALKLGLSSDIIAQTARGEHYFYSCPENTRVCNAVRKWPGIDIRGDGGYVVAAPSIHPSGERYRWRKWGTSQLSVVPTQFITPREPISAASKDTSGEWLTPLLKGLRQGNRNDTFTRIIGKLHDGRTTPSDIFVLLRPHSLGCGMADQELRGIIQSVTRYGREKTASLDVYSAANFDDFKHYLNLAANNSANIQTGLQSLDAATGGLRAGEIVTVGARTGIGKTSFVLGLARKLLENNHRLLLFTTELSRFTVLERLTSPWGNEKFKTLGQVGANLFIVDKGSPTVADIRETAERIKPNVLFFDHVQHSGGSAQSDRENVSRLVRGIKDIARDVNCSVVVCSQIRRLWKPHNGNEQSPGLSDLKESGTIEEESCAVLLLSNLSESYGENSVTLMADLAKNRYGPLTRFTLEFNKSAGLFREVKNDG